MLPYVTHYTHKPTPESLDGFIVKINPLGEVLWGTYFGGDGEDFIESIAIDQEDNVLVMGFTNSLNGIADASSYQPQNAGSLDSFLAKFNPDGIKIWSTYFGGSSNESGYEVLHQFGYTSSGLAVDGSGNLYLFMGTYSGGLTTPNSFQPVKTNNNSIFAKFNQQGMLEWSSYYGINSSFISAIAINGTGVYLAGDSNDLPNAISTYFATPGCHQQPASHRDAFLSKFDFNGQRIWSTYYGASTGIEVLDGFNLKTFGNSIYLSGSSAGNNNIATPGAFQENRNGGLTSFLAKFNENGVREWGTYCGLDSGNDGYSFTNTGIDHEGNVYLTGSTSYIRNIGTAGSYQPELASARDGFVVKFNAAGERIWGTYYGGEQQEFSAQLLAFADGFYIVGTTKSSNGMSTENSLQPLPVFNQYQESTFIARFKESLLGVNDMQGSTVAIYPNPAKGYFQLKVSEKNCDIVVYNALGQEVLKRGVVDGELVDVSGLVTGIYYVMVSSLGIDKDMEKLVVQ